MSYNTGPKIVTSGLIMNLDVGNHKSYAGRNLLSWNSWAAGSGGCTGYNQNGGTVENERVAGTDPWGNSNIVWETRPANDYPSGDGGWNTDWFNIDRTKLYRYSVWMKRTSSATTGTFYFGAYGNNSGMDNAGGDTGNPYWQCANIGSYTQNVWYLVVGHIHPYGTSGYPNHPNSGQYTIANGKVYDLNYCNISTDMKWKGDNTQGIHRVYHYYATDNTSHMQLFQPRVDLCDGTEPTITQLLNNNPGTQLYDLSGKNNHALVSGGPSYSDGKFTLDGSTQGFTKPSALTGATTNCTVVMFYSTVDTTELWAMGNQSGAWYLAAADGGGAYYHSNVGSPTYYVDLGAVTYPSPYRNGAYHMWEAKNVDFSAWTYFDWFSYSGTWHMAGSVAAMLVYDRPLTPQESLQNYYAYKTRFNLP